MGWVSFENFVLDGDEVIAMVNLQDHNGGKILNTGEVAKLLAAAPYLRDAAEMALKVLLEDPLVSNESVVVKKLQNALKAAKWT